MLNSNENVLRYVLFVASILAVGGAVYLAQNVKHRKVNDELKSGYEEKVVFFKGEIESLRKQIEDLKNEADRRKQQNIEPVSEPSGPTLKLLSPKGGERICLGNNFTIKWEHSGLKTVNLFVEKDDHKYVYSLGTFPADYNEEGKTGLGIYDWKVGKEVRGGSLLGEGNAYTFLITGRPKNEKIPPLQDNTEDIFSIQVCEG